MRIILECDITYKYTYDNYGNILSKSTYKLNTTTLINADTYTYDNANYKDQLTKFNNDTITYDGIGNPLKIGNTTYNWSNGRELQSISNTNLNVSYKYDRNGIRTKKILNNEEISYVLENTSIVIEKHKDYMLYFLRDDSNSLLGFTYNNKTYYYKKNAFDDIIGIYDSNYKEVCTYSYDAYGNILSIKDNTGKNITDTSNIAIINPFRYRSYYYDTETNLYYLNSRYYSPRMGRFINCDGIIGSYKSVTGYNLYAYCSNNPVDSCDMNGFFFKKILTDIKNIFSSSKNNKVNKVENKNKMPLTDKPNSWIKNPNGNIRVYGDDGRAIKDIDWGHPNHHPELSNPHVHDWTYDGKPIRGKAREASDAEKALKISIGLGIVAGTGYAVYRGLRILPSLTPFTWWTLPGNIIMP